MTPLIVTRQGSFAIGGTITTNEQEVKKNAVWQIIAAKLHFCIQEEYILLVS